MQLINFDECKIILLACLYKDNIIDSHHIALFMSGSAIKATINSKRFLMPLIGKKNQKLWSLSFGLSV